MPGSRVRVPPLLFGNRVTPLGLPGFAFSLGVGRAPSAPRWLDFDDVGTQRSPGSLSDTRSGSGATFLFVCDTVPSDETVVQVAEYPYPLRDLCQLASGAKSRFSTRFHQDSAGCVARNSCVGWAGGGELVGMGDFAGAGRGSRQRPCSEPGWLRAWICHAGNSMQTVPYRQHGVRRVPVQTQASIELTHIGMVTFPTPAPVA